MAGVLLLQSVTEVVLSDEQPTPDAMGLLAAIVPPVAVAFSRVRPEQSAAAVVAVLVATSMEPTPSGTLGAGFAWLAVAFGVAAWSRQPWPWLAALLVAGTMQDVRTPNFDATDVMIDWVFLGSMAGVGRVVHRRQAQAEALTTRLELADAERETHTRDAVAHERALIARELHDIVAHAVSLMVVQAGTARPVAERVSDELAEVLETIEVAGREALTELRRLLHVLRSVDEPDLPPLPHLGRLDHLLDGVRRAGVDVRATVNLPSAIPPGVGLCAYRAVQEGLTNAMRYADGSRVDVEVMGDGQRLHVRVRDHGSRSAPQHLGSGMGYAGLRERVLLCGGRLTAGPTASGFELQVTLPLTDESLPADGRPPQTVEGWSG